MILQGAVKMCLHSIYQTDHVNNVGGDFVPAVRHAFGDDGDQGGRRSVVLRVSTGHLLLLFEWVVWGRHIGWGLGSIG